MFCKKIAASLIFLFTYFNMIFEAFWFKKKYNFFNKGQKYIN